MKGKHKKVMEMDKLLVYYSKSGATRKVAEEIASATGAIIEEIIDKRSRSGFFGFITAGKDAASKKLTEIQKIENNPSKFSMVIIGTPVWAGNMAPAIRTYISENDLSRKKVALFCVSGGQNPGPVFSDMKSLIKGNVLAEEHFQSKDVKSGSYAERARGFASKLK